MVVMHKLQVAVAVDMAHRVVLGNMLAALAVKQLPSMVKQLHGYQVTQQEFMGV
jgi:hypothetical protein